MKKKKNQLLSVTHKINNNFKEQSEGPDTPLLGRRPTGGENLCSPTYAPRVLLAGSRRGLKQREGGRNGWREDGEEGREGEGRRR